MNPNQYLILLGKAEDLAFAELQSLCLRFGLTDPTRISHHLAIISGDANPETLISAAGGIVKIYKPISQSEDTAANDIASDLKAHQITHFALSATFKHHDLMGLGSDIKRILNKDEIKPHFRLLDDAYVSAGIMTKSVEYCICDLPDKAAVWQAVAVQNLNYWSSKDFGRPMSDPKSGMMPPKIARMMINIALTKTPTIETVIYDPFCGSGTTLMETLDVGASAIGSDLSQKAVTISQTNCDWFKTKYQPAGDCQLFVADATHLPGNNPPQAVDAIVFEGYLGSPHPDMSRIDNIVRGLDKMYKGVFKQLYRKLKSKGIIVCALPEFVLGKSVKNLDHLIDDIVKLGYTRAGRFTYSRPQAQVRRIIYVLHKVSL